MHQYTQKTSMFPEKITLLGKQILKVSYVAPAVDSNIYIYIYTKGFGRTLGHCMTRLGYFAFQRLEERAHYTNSVLIRLAGTVIRACGLAVRL